MNPPKTIAPTPTPSLKDVLKSPELFARHFVKIINKQMQPVPLRYNPIQRRYLQERTARDLILKPRQMGMSTAIQTEFLRYAITRRVYTLTLMDKSENTTEIRRRATGYYDSIPSPILYDGAHIVKPKRRTDNDTESVYENGSVAVIGTAGALNAGRSRTFSHIHLSEVAFYTDAQAIVKSALQAGSPVWVVAESTANGASGWFYDRCMEALNGDSVWKLHFYKWFDFPEYQTPHPADFAPTYDEKHLIDKHALTLPQIAWRRAKIAEIGVLDDFLQEYPEDIQSVFKRSGVGYFGDIERAFNAPLDAQPDKAHRYVAGLDFGQQDCTALFVLDCETLAQVDLLRVNKRSWADIRHAILETTQKWGIEIILAEKNAMGGSQIEMLRDEAYTLGLGVDIRGFDMTHITKPKIMAQYRIALHENNLQLQPLDIQKAELASAVAKETQRGWTVESPRDKDGSHGDTIIAGALAWRAYQLSNIDFDIIRV